MKNIITISLLFLSSLIASAQDMVISTTGNNLNSRISLKEMSSFKQSMDGDNSKIEIELVSGAKITLDPEMKTSIEAVDENHSYYLGRLSNLKPYVLRPNLSKFKRGEFIGIFHEDDYSADEFPVAAYSDGALAMFGTFFQAGVTLNIQSLARKNNVTKNDIRFHVADIVYSSVDTDGEPIALSARLVYPYIANGSSSLTISTMYLDNHFTIFEESGAPSSTFGTSCGLTGMASRGYLVVQPDLIGFGASSSRTQQYVDQTINPKIVADCLLAAKSYAEMTTMNTKIPTINLSRLATKLINTGASQGASTALGLQYYMEKELTTTERRQLPTLSETRICAGAYNMVGTLDYFVKNDTLLYAPIFPLMVQGAIVAHPDIMKYSDGTPMRVHDFFSPELEDFKLDMSYFGVEGQYTIWEILNSKQQGSSFLTFYLPMFYGGMKPDYTSYVLVHKMLADGMLNEVAPDKYELNRDDERVQALLKVLEYSNLSDPEKWVPKTKITMTHASDDTWVPYINSSEFYDNMIAQGANLSFTTLDKSADIGNHGIICYVWILSELYRLPTPVVMSVVRSLMSSLMPPMPMPDPEPDVD